MMICLHFDASHTPVNTLNKCLFVYVMFRCDSYLIDIAIVSLFNVSIDDFLGCSFS